MIVSFQNNFTTCELWCRKGGRRMCRMFEIFKEFTFEAAHQLAVNVGDGHPYARLHGHSFKVEIFLRGEADPMTTGSSISVRSIEGCRTCVNSSITGILMISKGSKYQPSNAFRAGF